MHDPSAIVGNSTGWAPFVCERWRAERVREVSGLVQHPYLPVDGRAELVPPSFLSAQYVDAFDLGIPDAPARLNGGNACRWLADVRVGEALERNSTVVDVEVKRGRTGRLELYTIETVYRRTADSRAEVAKLRYTAIRRFPQSPTAPSASPGPRPTGNGRPTGAELPEGATRVFTATVSPRDVVRYAVATEDLYEAHYDESAARASGLPGTIVHGLLKLAWLARGALEYGGTGSVLRELSASYRGMDLVKDDFTVWVAPEPAGTGATGTRLHLFGQSRGGAISTVGTAVVEPVPTSSISSAAGASPDRARTQTRFQTQEEE
ncbi:FAS1-like dehydratase domain-containing protein [Plantactinospora soyae]|uniref:Acyl dehydratase n=1 Tax=Plantactinospora soyae TaxID=1544732 RepID=A0A927M7E8_9ACTN|nr:MaoC family dehydratase N-terminal domain-containing protein [Plantactinospora soyae]MBE1489543.1 acyl dehydratase [Plantactinospora soyae]